MAAALSSYPFIAPGHPYTVDTWPHLARQSIVYHAIKEGFSPFYTFMYYCGFPALRFYSPLFSFLGGPLTLLTGGNLLLALRILLVASHLVSALAMYLYLRRSEAQGKKKGEVAGFGPALGAIVYDAVPELVQKGYIHTEIKGHSKVLKLTQKFRNYFGEIPVGGNAKQETASAAPAEANPSNTENQNQQ